MTAPLSPVKHGKHDNAVVQVTDEGGIPRSGMPRIWTYLYSTAPVIPGLRDSTTVTSQA